MDLLARQDGADFRVFFIKALEVLMEGAAVDNVEQLHAPADAQQRQSPFLCLNDQLFLHGITSGIETAMLGHQQATNDENQWKQQHAHKALPAALTAVVEGPRPGRSLRAIQFRIDIGAAADDQAVNSFDGTQLAGPDPQGAPAASPDRKCGE